MIQITVIHTDYSPILSHFNVNKTQVSHPENGQTLPSDQGILKDFKVD